MGRASGSPYISTTCTARVLLIPNRSASSRKDEPACRAAMIRRLRDALSCVLAAVLTLYTSGGHRTVRAVIERSGATPRIGAIPGQPYPFGPAWAAYRLPCPGASEFVTPREAGVAFEGEPADGPNPPAGDPPKPPATPPAPAQPPATGEPAPDADGMTTDAGRRALAAERDRAKALQKELDDLRAASATDDEKREASIKAAAASERDEYWAGRIRTSEVRSALRAAGLTNDKALVLAVNAPEFAALEVSTDDGSVKGLDKTIEAFRKDYPEMFAQPKPAGQPTRGPQSGADKDRPKSLSDAVAAHYAARA